MMSSADPGVDQVLVPDAAPPHQQAEDATALKRRHNAAPAGASPDRAPDAALLLQPVSTVASASAAASSGSITAAVLLGFSDPPTESRFVAFKSSLLASVSSRWSLTKLCILISLVLRSVFSGSQVATASLLLLGVPYAVLWLTLHRGHLGWMEPLHLGISLSRYMVHWLWASGQLLYPSGPAVGLDHLLLNACELAGCTNFEQVRQLLFDTGELLGVQLGVLLVYACTCLHVQT